MKLSGSIASPTCWLVAAACLSQVGCGDQVPPATQAEQRAGYTYVPLDPLPVEVQGDPTECVTSAEDTNTIGSSKVLRLFPDNTVRTSAQHFQADGSISYGVGSVATKGQRYRVTVDYINADAKNVKFCLQRRAVKVSSGGEYSSIDSTRGVSASSDNADEQSTEGGEEGGEGEVQLLRVRDPLPQKLSGAHQRYRAYRIKPGEVCSDSREEEVNVPVYIGIGVRATADIKTIASSASISGLGTIGAEAQAENLRGSLVLQTLGVNGRSISAALPVQSELNRTTAQNAVAAVGAVKALLYENKTLVTPRVVGMYLPFPGRQEIVNALLSALSSSRIEWKPPCRHGWTHEEEAAPGGAAEENAPGSANDDASLSETEE